MTTHPLLEAYEDAVKALGAASPARITYDVFVAKAAKAREELVAALSRAPEAEGEPKLIIRGIVADAVGKLEAIEEAGDDETLLGRYKEGFQQGRMSGAKEALAALYRRRGGKRWRGDPPDRQAHAAADARRRGRLRPRDRRGAVVTNPSPSASVMARLRHMRLARAAKYSCKTKRIDGSVVRKVMA